MFRCVIVNFLILEYIGAVGMSSFTASHSVMAIFWPVVFGMMAVNRMLLNINVGEEDRQSTIDIMLVVLVGFAESWTRLFFRDPADPVYGMTILAFRILPLCMPLSEDERPVFGECP